MTFILWVFMMAVFIAFTLELISIIKNDRKYYHKKKADKAANKKD